MYNPYKIMQYQNQLTEDEDIYTAINKQHQQFMAQYWEEQQKKKYKQELEKSIENRIVEIVNKAVQDAIQQLKINPTINLKL